MFKICGPSWMGYFEKRIPYPLRALRLSISFRILPQWKPTFHYKKELTEIAKQQGTTIWWANWLWVQVSYSRWL